MQIDDKYGDKPVSVLLNISHTVTVDQYFRTNSFRLLIPKSMHNKRSNHNRVYSLSSTLLPYKHTHLYRHVIYTNIQQSFTISCNPYSMQYTDIQYLIQQIEQSIINNIVQHTKCYGNETSWTLIIFEIFQLSCSIL